MDIVLVPGLWLHGSSWDTVIPALQAAGHRTHPVTLPGMETKDADRSKVGLADCIDAVTSVIDACEDRVLLVGHSLGSAVATAALDARVDKVLRLIVVGGWPATSGRPIAEGFTVEGDGIPMPDRGEFDDADLAEMDEAMKADFVAGAIPSPAALATETLELTDDRRYEVPVTAVCPEYTVAQLTEWIAEGAPPVAEIPKYREVEYLDLSTGHWPQFTRPEELAKIIIGSVPISTAQFLDAEGTEDWRAVSGVSTFYPTASFRRGAELASRISDLAEVGNRRLDVDLRYEGVVVSLSHHCSFLIGRDVEVARQVSAAARDLGLHADPSRLQHLGFMLHPRVNAAVMPFWQAVLGYQPMGPEDVVDPLRRLTYFQFWEEDEAPEAAPDRMRFHVDIIVPHDDAEARVKAALAAGGRLVKEYPFWWTLADAEGNIVDVAHGKGREELWKMLPA